jgi:hypothetical protein
VYHVSCEVVKDSFTCLVRIERLGLAGRYHRGNEGDFSTTNGPTVWFLLLKSAILCFKALYPVSVWPVEPFQRPIASVLVDWCVSKGQFMRVNTFSHTHQAYLDQVLRPIHRQRLFPVRVPCIMRGWKGLIHVSGPY